MSCSSASLLAMSSHDMSSWNQVVIRLWKGFKSIVGVGIVFVRIEGKIIDSMRIVGKRVANLGILIFRKIDVSVTSTSPTVLNRGLASLI